MWQTKISCQCFFFLAGKLSEMGTETNKGADYVTALGFDVSRGLFRARKSIKYI